MSYYQNLLLRVLPRFHLYATYRGTLARRPALGTIPRIVPPPLSWDKMKVEVEAAHEGWVSPSSRRFFDSILTTSFNPWAAAWLRASVNYYIISNPSPEARQGWLHHRRSIVLHYMQPEGTIHELAHAWQDGKVAEGVLQLGYEGFTKAWSECLPALVFSSMWPNTEDEAWARDFREKVIVRDGVFTETYASTASRIMGDLSRLPLPLVPYFAPLFRR